MNTVDDEYRRYLIAIGITPEQFDKSSPIEKAQLHQIYSQWKQQIQQQQQPQPLPPQQPQQQNGMGRSSWLLKFLFRIGLFICIALCLKIVLRVTHDYVVLFHCFLSIEHWVQSTVTSGRNLSSRISSAPSSRPCSKNIRSS